MKKYKVWYRTEDGDCSKVWTKAANKKEAIEYVKREYWDVESIIDVEEMK